MFTQRLMLIALLTATSLAQAGTDQDWRIRIKKEATGWTASFSGVNEYGPAGRRTKGSGVMVEKARAVGAFTKLRLEGPMDVRLTQAGADVVKVLADDNIEPLVEARIEGDVLILAVQKGAGFSTRRTPVVQVDAKTLQAVTINGSGDVSLERFKGDSLSFNLSGSGDLRVGLLELKELTATISGSGDVHVAGRADTQTWTLNGSGDVDARSLTGRTVKAQLHGSGDLDLGVSEALDAHISGSGDLTYAGRPQLKQSVSGSGEISRR